MNLQESYQKYKTMFYECLKNDEDIKFRMMETPSSYLTMIRNSMIEMLNEFEDADNDSFIISNEKIPYINRYAGFINIITGDMEIKGHKVIHQNISQHYKNQMARFMLFDGIYGRNVYISYINENGAKQAYKLLKKKFNDLGVDCYIIDVSDGTDKDNFVKTFVYDSKGKEYSSDVLELGKDVPWLRNYLNEYLGINMSKYDKQINEVLKLAGVQLNEAGYQGYSKSNNAIEAESEGRFPASVAAKKLGVSTEAIRENIPTSEWHHYSNHYNQVYVYDITPYLMLKNGEDMLDDYDEDEINEFKEIYAHMKEMSKPNKDDGKKYKANVDYIEWTGSMKHPKANKHHYENIKVLEKGHFYTFYLPNGEEVRKKIGSNGTYVESIEQVKARLAKEKERAKAQKEWEKQANLAFKEFKRNTSKNALQFLKQPFLELNSNGTHIYKNGRKPSQWDYDNLSKFFKQGELRCSSKYPDGLSNAGVYLEQWNGEKWISIEETAYNVETGIFYLGLNFIQKQLGVEYK